MANSYTLTDIADLCHNEIRMIGILTEFAADAYVKNDVGVIRYKGVVNCDDAFIPIKATTTSFDDTFKPFIDEFNTDVVGRKVFVIGKLNSGGGVNVDYIAMAYNENFFQGNIVGIGLDDETALVIDNDYHMIIPVKGYKCDDSLLSFELDTNTLVAENGIISKDGYPPIITRNISPYKIIGDELEDLKQQALDEHEIYLEAMEQIREGR